MRTDQLLMLDLAMGGGIGIGGMGGGGQYWQQVLAALRPYLVTYRPLWEASGTAIGDISVGGVDGAYSNATLGRPGIGDGKTSAGFDGTGYGNILTSNVVSKFSGSEGWLNLFMNINEAAHTELAYLDAFRAHIDTSNRIYIQKAGTNTDALVFTYKSGNVNSIPTGPTQLSSYWAGFVMATLTWSKSNDRVRAYLNAVSTGADVTGLGNWLASNLTLAVIGAASIVPAGGFKGDLAELTIGSKELTQAEINLLYSGLKQSLVVWEGDSRTVGTGATNACNFPQQAARKLSGNWKCINAGDSGQSLVTMLSEIATELAIPAGNWLKKVAVLWGGVNDNTDAATMHTRIANWCLAAKAMGYKVVVCTEIDCQATGFTAWHNTEYLALNALIRANYPSYANGCADLGGDARLQDATNLTYFGADHMHPVSAGYLAAAEVAAPVVNAV